MDDILQDFGDSDDSDNDPDFVYDSGHDSNSEEECNEEDGSIE